MATFSSIAPFGVDPISEVPLDAAPIVAVIAQLRFPQVASIATPAFVGPFQEELRPTYPVMRHEKEVRVTLTPNGVTQAPESDIVWRFVDLEESWRVSLAPSFLSLEATGEYTSRTEFIARLRSVVQALENHIKPSVYDRLGVRYVDRVEIDEDLPVLSELIRPEVLGVSTCELGGGSTLARSIVDSEFRLNDSALRARWGTLPASTGIDPFHGAPSSKPIWLLDLDMYTAEGVRPFAVGDVVSLAENYAAQIYRVFRWAVSEEFLKHFGGNP